MKRKINCAFLSANETLFEELTSNNLNLNYLASDVSINAQYQ